MQVADLVYAQDQVSKDYSNLIPRSGLDRRILDILLAMCRKNGTNKTGPIIVKELAKVVGTTLGSAKNALQRLKAGGLITRDEFKGGQGGAWSSFKVVEGILDAELPPCPTVALATVKTEMDNAGKDRQTAKLPLDAVDKKDSEPVWIYFIREGQEGNIKIGFSVSHPNGRMSALQTGSSAELSLIHFIKATRGLEAELHSRFMHLHVRGEWFKPERDLINFIATLKNTGKLPITEGAFAAILQQLKEVSLSDEQIQQIKIAL